MRDPRLPPPPKEEPPIGEQKFTRSGLFTSALGSAARHGVKRIPKLPEIPD
jgi:hypothetical protein